MSQKSKDDHQIRIDLHRTNFGFEESDPEEKDRVEAAVFNVLRAFSNYDGKCGYVQGMHSIAAALSYNLHPSHFQDQYCR